MLVFAYSYKQCALKNEAFNHLRAMQNLADDILNILKQNKYFNMSSAAAVIGVLRYKCDLHQLLLTSSSF